MKARIATVFFAMLALSTLAAAVTLQGTATNGTTGKPAAGAEVTLLSLAQGMSEAGHTKTDNAGRFQFDYDDTGMPHLVRVTHQNVNYFNMVPPGTNSVQLQVYDSARKLEGIGTSVEVMRLQASGGALQVMHIYAVRNTSTPPRTLVPDHSYEIALPAGAVIDEAAARAPNGQPINAMPDAVKGQKDHYVFNFPLRPGETQFQVAYHLPYSGGQAVITPTLLHDVQHFVAVLPTSMQFSATGASFSPMADQKDANVQVTTNAHAGDRIAMTISGSGVLADENTPSDQAQTGGTMSGGPGGGLGAPINSPDPLSRYRWPLLGAIAVLLVAGGFFVVNHRVPATVTPNHGSLATSPGNIEPDEDSVPVSKMPAKPSSALLDVMKEELFQLELDRQQGRLSEEEYQKAKAALDTTLKRVVNRQRSAIRDQHSA